MPCRPVVFIVFSALVMGLACMAAPAAAETYIRHMEAAALTASGAKDGSTAVRLALAGQLVDLRVQTNDALLAGLPEALRKQLDANGFEVLEGGVEGRSGSWARLNRQGQRWSGAWFDGESLYLLDPAEAARDLGALPKGADHVVYRLDDVHMEGFEHDEATPRRRLDYLDWVGHLGTSEPTAHAKNGLRELRLTVVTDTEFSAQHGSNRDAVVLSRLNVVDGIYREQLRVQIALHHLRHLSDNGPLTLTLANSSDGSPTLLTVFRSYMTTAPGNAIPKGGLNHLFSGKDFDGNIVGVAYRGVLCSSQFGYGINQIRSSSTTTALTVAHEMGHNFGAPHDGQSGSACQAQTGSWLMSPSINGSQTFSQCSRDIIAPLMAAASCLLAVTPPGYVFGSGFER